MRRVHVPAYMLTHQVKNEDCLLVVSNSLGCKYLDIFHNGPQFVKERKFQIIMAILDKQLYFSQKIFLIVQH